MQCRTASVYSVTVGEAVVQSGPSTKSNEKNILSSAEEKVTVYEQAMHKGHQRGRIGPDEWITLTTAEGEVKALPATANDDMNLSLGTVLAEPIDYDIFHKRIAQVSSLRTWSAWAVLTLPLLPLSGILTIVVFWKSRCFRNSNYRMLMNARINGLHRKSGARNEWVQRTEEEEDDDDDDDDDDDGAGKKRKSKQRCPRCMTIFAMIGLRAAAIFVRLMLSFLVFFALVIVFLESSFYSAFETTTNFAAEESNSTIFSDQCALANNGNCDEPHSCERGMDAVDCGYTPCFSMNDGVCDEPHQCDFGTDANDCAVSQEEDFKKLIVIGAGLGALLFVCCCGEAERSHAKPHGHPSACL
jgi:hypothetical protein